MKFRTQRFISKHCQAKYNVNRDKVTCLRRIKHNLEIENKTEKAFAVITFQTQLERFEIQANGGESNHLTQCMTGSGSGSSELSRTFIIIVELGKCFSYEATDTDFSIQLQKMCSNLSHHRKAETKFPPMCVTKYCKAFRTSRFFTFYLSVSRK